MKALLAAALGLAAAGPAGAADFPVKLPDGAIWTMTVERQRERQRGTAPPEVSDLKTTTRLTLEREGRLVSELLDADAGGAETQDLAAAMGLDRPVQLDVDESLAPERIRNWDAVRNGLEAAVQKATSDPRAAEGAMRLFGGLSAEQAGPVLMRDLSMASLAQGASLEVGEPAEYEDRLPNPLGGPPIKSVGRFELVSHDAARGQAVITWRQRLDPASMAESLAQGLEAMVKKIEPSQAPKLREAFKDAKVARNDTCRHEIDTPTGLAVRVACESVVEITVQGETGRNVDRWTITQSLPKTTP